MSRALLLAPLLLMGCLERVTDSPPPLDPRYYEGAEAEGGPGRVSRRPFSDYEGPTVALRGTIGGGKRLPVDLDLWSVKPEAPGEREHLGKLALEGPGPFELKVPKGYGGLQLEAFQDIEGDGPTDDDPFATVLLEVGEEDIEGIELQMEVGARAAAAQPAARPGPVQAEGPVHREAPPGAPGGPPVAGSPVPAPGGGGQPWMADPFAGVEGPRFRLEGRIVLEGAEPGTLVDIDVFRMDPSGPGGRVFAGKFKRPPGDFELEIPQSLGTVSLVFFLDRDGDGPTPGDPLADCPCNPLDLSGEGLDGLVVELH